MTNPSPISRRSIDQLEHDIITLSQRMNAQEFEFLVLVREFDIRQGWKAYHFNNCAEWLNMKCGITLATGREKVRVATALYDLPQCSKAFAEGLLSYSKARALTRAANPLNEQALLDYALPRTASQVEEHCRQLRNADRRASTPDANRAHASRYLSRTDNGDGTVSINIELPNEMADVVMKAIEVAAADCPAPVEAENDNSSFFAQQADALVQVAHEFLAGGAGKTLSTADNYQVMVHVDEMALRDMGGKSDLPVESVRRICCDASMTEVTKDEAGNPLATGRKHRVVQPALKRALLARDRHCQFPGCSHENWLDAHHVMHWADGGQTSLANTMLLCSKHHRLLHEGGYTIEKNFRGDWYFRHANGRAIASFALYPVTDTNASRDASGERHLPEGPGSNRINEPWRRYGT